MAQQNKSFNQEPISPYNLLFSKAPINIPPYPPQPQYYPPQYEQQPYVDFPEELENEIRESIGWSDEEEDEGDYRDPFEGSEEELQDSENDPWKNRSFSEIPFDDPAHQLFGSGVHPMDTKEYGLGNQPQPVSPSTARKIYQEAMEHADSESTEYGVDTIGEKESLDKVKADFFQLPRVEQKEFITWLRRVGRI